MQLKVDPRVPTVWRDPFSLQFGVDPARVILRDVSLTEEQVIAALIAGVSRAGLSMVGRAAGVTERTVERILGELQPLVRSTPAAAPVPAVSLVGTGPTVDLLASTLRAAGLAVGFGRELEHELDPAAGAACDLGIAVGHYVLDPASYGFWLRRDLPHLPIIYGDGVVTVGPLVEPGRTACLYCLEHHRRDADASWSAIASQLWGRRSAAETPLAVQEVVAMASRFVVRRLGAGGSSPAFGGTGGASAGPMATSFRIEVDSGEVTRREWMPHPDCGCVGLTAEIGPNAGLSETATAGDSVPLMRSAVVRAHA